MAHAATTITAVSSAGYGTNRHHEAGRARGAVKDGGTRAYTEEVMGALLGLRVRKEPKQKEGQLENGVIPEG